MNKNQNMSAPEGISVPFSCKAYERNKESSYHPWLHHHNHCEIVYCTDGLCSCLIEATKYYLTPGDMLIIYPNEPHKVGLLENFCKYKVIQFSPELIDSAMHTQSERAYTLLIMQKKYNYGNYIPAKLISDADIDGITKKLHREFSNKAFGYDLAMRVYITELMLFIIRIWEKEHPEISQNILSSKHSALLQKAILYSTEHFQDINEEILAKSIGVSTSHLSRLFKNGMNTSFSAFVNSVKLKEAERMLLTTNLNVTEISLSSGFATTAYFIKLFKEKHGKTPLQYRKSAKKFIIIKD